MDIGFVQRQAVNDFHVGLFNGARDDDDCRRVVVRRRRSAGELYARDLAGAVSARRIES